MQLAEVCLGSNPRSDLVLRQSNSLLESQFCAVRKLAVDQSIQVGYAVKAMSHLESRRVIVRHFASLSEKYSLAVRLFRRAG